MSKVILDDLPITSIGWYPNDSMPQDYQRIHVGKEGVTKIDVVEQYLGEYAIVWVQVWCDDDLVARYNARNIDSILY